MSALRIVIIGGWAQRAEHYEVLARALEKVLSASASEMASAAKVVKILALETEATVLYQQLDALARKHQASDARVLWLGCSLGGQHLLHWLQQRGNLAHRNEYVVLFGTNPHFCEVAQGYWPGMAEASLRSMMCELEADRDRTVRAFNMLQCKGLPATRRKEALRALNSLRSAATHEVLQQGLQALISFDARPAFLSCPLPATAFFGACDLLTGRLVANALQESIAGSPNGQQPRLTVHLLEEAGHYPDEVTSDLIANASRVFLDSMSLPAMRLETHG